MHVLKFNLNRCECIWIENHYFYNYHSIITISNQKDKPEEKTTATFIVIYILHHQIFKGSI